MLRVLLIQTFDSNNFLLFLLFAIRQVSPGDIQAIEKRLMQTMDLIVVKKKRIAMAKRGVQVPGSPSGPTSPSLWNMLRTVTTKETPESILSCNNLFTQSSIGEF